MTILKGGSECLKREFCTLRQLSWKLKAEHPSTSTKEQTIINFSDWSTSLSFRTTPFPKPVNESKRKRLIGSGFSKWIFEKLILLFEEDYFPLDIALKVVDTYIYLMYETHVVPFQLILLGDDEVGKTSFIKRFQSEVKPDINFEHHQVTFDTDEKIVRFDVLDPTVRLDNLMDITHYSTPTWNLKDTQCCIIMFNVCARITYKNVPNWYRSLFHLNKDSMIPTCIVGNKVDEKGNRKVQAKHVTFHRKKNCGYSDVSALGNYNLELPFLYLLNRLLGKNQTSQEQNEVSGKLRNSLLPPSVHISQDDANHMRSNLAQIDEFYRNYVEDDEDF